MLENTEGTIKNSKMDNP